MDGTRWQAERARSLSIDERPRNANREIRRKRLVFEVRFDDPILSRRKPVPDLRGTVGDSADLAQHFDALKVAAIEPAEVRHTGLGRLPVYELDHRLDPAGINAPIKPSLVGALDLGITEEALERVALPADAALDLGELAASDAGLGWNTPRVTRHLRGTGEPANDLPGARAGKPDDLPKDAAIKILSVVFASVFGSFGFRFGSRPGQGCRVHARGEKVLSSSLGAPALSSNHS